MKKLNENKGITLIALVITIIVMLILAGVTINLTIGENGIFKTAQLAAKNYTNAQEKELADLAEFNNTLNDTIKGQTQEEKVQLVTEITLNKTETTLGVGSAETLTASISPSNATNKNLTWTSSNESVATVSEGTITAVAAGTTTITATAKDGSGKSASCNVTVNNPTLLSQITASDYGKSINYSVTVNGTVLSNWRVFYNDGTNVYIILSDYLKNSLIPSATGMKTTGTYQAYWENTTNTAAVATLTDTSYWSAFAGGQGGSSAIGSPTNGMFVASWNANPKTSTTLTAGSAVTGLTDSTGLYIPHTSVYEGCYGYWLASPLAGTPTNVWLVNSSGSVRGNLFGDDRYGVRPVVCLTSGITGTVGDAVTID